MPQPTLYMRALPLSSLRATCPTYPSRPPSSPILPAIVRLNTPMLSMGPMHTPSDPQSVRAPITFPLPITDHITIPGPSPVITRAGLIMSSRWWTTATACTRMARVRFNPRTKVASRGFQMRSC